MLSEQVGKRPIDIDVPGGQAKKWRAAYTFQKKCPLATYACYIWGFEGQFLHALYIVITFQFITPFIQRVRARYLFFPNLARKIGLLAGSRRTLCYLT